MPPLTDKIRLALAKPPRRLRAKPSRGLRGGQTAIDRAGGDYGAGLIRGAALCTSGEAIGHDMWLDGEFLQQVVDGLAAKPGGVKCHFAHPSLSGDGLGTFLGRAKNAVLDGQVVRADVHLSATAHNSPDGDLAGYVLDLAQEDPAAFGVSIVYYVDVGAEDRFVAEHEDEEGEFVSPDPQNGDNLPHARLAELLAADVVDDPAANPDGLFHRHQQAATDADALLSYALGLSAQKPSLTTFAVDPDRAAQFVQRFLDAHHLTILEKSAMEKCEKCGADMPPDATKCPTCGAFVSQQSTAPKTPAAPHAGPSDPPPVETLPPADPVETDPPAVPAEPPAAPPVASQSAAKTGQNFLDAFGDRGGVWFAQGKTWDESQAAYAAELKAENESLRARIAGVEFGQSNGVSALPAEDSPQDNQAHVAAAFAGRLPENVARFAAGIQLPSRN